MNFFVRKKNYEDILSFLISEYQYKLAEKDVSKGSFFSEFIFRKDKFPTIRITVERGYISSEIKIGRSFWGIPEVYKFLNHGQVVRCIYRTMDDVIKYFESDMKQYLNDIFAQRDLISNEKLNLFYKEFPPAVFVWN